MRRVSEKHFWLAANAIRKKKLLMQNLKFLYAFYKSIWICCRIWVHWKLFFFNEIFIEFSSLIIFIFIYYVVRVVGIKFSTKEFSSKPRSSIFFRYYVSRTITREERQVALNKIEAIVWWSELLGKLMHF